jgi:hypothetical protein
MMNAKDEEAAIRRAVTLAEVRRLCNDWGYWCARSNVRTGYEPFMSTGVLSVTTKPLGSGTRHLRDFPRLTKSKDLPSKRHTSDSQTGPIEQSLGPSFVRSRGWCR